MQFENMKKSELIEYIRNQEAHKEDHASMEFENVWEMMFNSIPWEWFIIVNAVLISDENYFFIFQTATIRNATDTFEAVSRAKVEDELDEDDHDDHDSLY